MAWVWAIGALFLAIIELHAPGMYLIWIAAGAGITALAALVFALAPEGQFIVFAASSPLACIAGYFVYRHALHRHRAEPAPNQRERALIGARGVVAEPIRDGRGKIRLGNSVWLAEGPDLPQGAPVVVKALRDTTVIVAAATEQATQAPTR